MSQKQVVVVMLVLVTVASIIDAALAAPMMHEEMHEHVASCSHSSDATGAHTSTPEPRPKRQAPNAVAAGNSEQPGSGVMNFFSNLGPQVDQLKSISSIFSSSSSSSSSPNVQPAATQQSAMGLMSQLGDMVRSAQVSSDKMVQNQQQAAMQTQQQAVDTAQSTSNGFAAALSEIGQGLKRIATNNPSLVPEVKQLYTSVSQKLSSSSSSPQQSNSNNPLNIQPATNSEQLADNLAKVMLKPQSA